MNTEVYRYSFLDDVNVEEIEISIVLTVMAIESLHGESRARLEIGHFLDPDKRVCIVDAGTEVGRDFNRLFVGFLRREFGDDSFQVERVDSARARCTETLD